MAVSKRTRFEVLRRDNYTCRYCGASAPEVQITVDHVVPVALGGSDDPTNLACACWACNSGKASTKPDEQTVADVSEDAIRWAKAMQLAAEMDRAARADDSKRLALFLQTWKQEERATPTYAPLPRDWEHAIHRNLAGGLDLDDMAEAVRVSMRASYVDDRFRYFMGVCKRTIDARVQAARELLDEGNV